MKGMKLECRRKSDADGRFLSAESVQGGQWADWISGRIGGVVTHPRRGFSCIVFLCYYQGFMGS